MRGFFGVGVVHPKREVNIGTLLRSAYAFGAAFVFTVGRRYSEQASDTTKCPRHVPMFHFATVDDLRGHLPFGCRLIGVELVDGATPLPEYKHPHRACYLLGAEDHGLTPEAVTACHDLVMIPGARFCLNVATAGSLVLYDRHVRGVVPPEGRRP